MNTTRVIVPRRPGPLGPAALYVRRDRERPAHPFAIGVGTASGALQPLARVVPVVRTRNSMLDGAKVRARREALGLLQCELAALIGISAGTLSKIERKKAISLALAQRVAWALRCGLDDLL